MSSSPRNELNREISRAVLSKLDEIAIPPTPENYTIWYHDLAHSNPDLSKTLRLIEGQNKPFTPDPVSYTHLTLPTIYPV